MTVRPSQSSATSVSRIMLVTSAVGAQVVRWASKCGASSDFIIFSVCECAAEAAQARNAAKANRFAIARIVASLLRYVYSP